MTWLVDPETRLPLGTITLDGGNWPPKPLPIYANFDYAEVPVTDPTPLPLDAETAPDVKSDPVVEPGPPADADDGSETHEEDTQ